MAPKFQAGEMVRAKKGPFKGAIGKIRFSTKLEYGQAIYYAVRLKETAATVYLHEDYLKKEREDG